MKTKDVKIGGLYEAKVSSRVQVVRIESARERWASDGRSLGMRWVATNVRTGRSITINSPQRLRREVTP